MTCVESNPKCWRNFVWSQTDFHSSFSSIINGIRSQAGAVPNSLNLNKCSPTGNTLRQCCAGAVANMAKYWTYEADADETVHFWTQVESKSGMTIDYCYKASGGDATECTSWTAAGDGEEVSDRSTEPETTRMYKHSQEMTTGRTLTVRIQCASDNAYRICIRNSIDAPCVTSFDPANGGLSPVISPSPPKYTNKLAITFNEKMAMIPGIKASSPRKQLTVKAADGSGTLATINLSEDDNYARDCALQLTDQYKYTGNECAFVDFVNPKILNIMLGTQQMDSQTEYKVRIVTGICCYARTIWRRVV